MQYAQQALKALLVSGLGKSRFTAGRVNFTDQSVNQKLALAASMTRESATIDMAEASDRVSLWHAKRLFQKVPKFWELADACRSRRAELPNGDVIPLKKFASMGSALCFPVEALVFFVSIIAIRLLEAGKFPTASLVRKYAQGVYIYGDDLIIPADEAPTISIGLESLGFKINRHKSFWNGHFRESCGSDYFFGEYVTPTYLSKDLPTDRRDASRIISAVSTANQLYHAGYHSTATAIREAVERLKGEFPLVMPNSPVVGWEFGTAPTFRIRWNKHLQRRETYTWKLTQAERPDEISGDAALSKAFLLCGSSSLLLGEDLTHLLRKVSSRFLNPGLADLSATPEDHLTVSPRLHALRLKRGWAYLPQR